MLKYLSEIGLNQEDSPEIKSKTELVNRLNAILLIIDVIYIIKSYMQGYPGPVLLLFVAFSTFCFLIYGLNYLRSFETARFLIAIIPIILASVLYSAVSQGPDDYLVGSMYIVYTACSIPFMVFSFKEKTQLISSFVFCALVTLFLRELNIFIDIPFDNTAAKTVGNNYFTVFLALTALFTAMYVQLSNTEKAFEKNRDVIAALEEKNDEFRKSQSKLEEYIKEVERAHEEEKKRKWASDGISQTSEILRSNDNLETMYAKLTGFLVKYLGTNQGALFILEDFENRQVLQLKATYAYDRRKHMDRVIEIGDGNVGQCFLEKEPIILKKVPQNYVHITSGLGEATASCVVLIPLKMDENVEGVLEIASFNMLEDYKIDFLNKIGESIASIVHNLKINERTRLLYEQSQLQSEQMRAQEEEMRQNLEELMATQEEMQRKETELLTKSEILEIIIDNIPFPVFIKDDKGRYTLVNKAEADIFNVPKSEIIGFDDSKFVIDAKEMARIRESDKKIVQENVPVHFPEQYLTLDNGVIKVFRTSKIPFYNKMTQKINILGVSVDLSDTKNVERELMKEIEILKKKLAINS